MGLRQTIGNAIKFFLQNDEAFDDEYQNRLERYEALRRLVRGEHKKNLKVKPNQFDDNITLNFTGLVVDRSVSMLFGKGIDFDFGEEATPNVMILPRLIALHPGRMTIETDPEDQEKVIEYRVRFDCTVTGSDGKDMEVSRLETVSRETTEESQNGTDEQSPGLMTPRQVETGYWIIREYKLDKTTQGKWQQMGQDIRWEYPFPPILHWQNLPDPEGPYGISDVEDIDQAQDRLNFINSNISKIIRFFAHPFRWGKNINTTEPPDTGPDKWLRFSGTDAAIGQLDATGDLASSRNFAIDIRQALFDISRTQDMSNLLLKSGQLTDFGLHVAMWDALNKNETKRELYGDAILELNRRLLAFRQEGQGEDRAEYLDLVYRANKLPMFLDRLGYFGSTYGTCYVKIIPNGIEFDASDADSIVWPDPLPVDVIAQTNALVQQVGAGLVSKETAARELGRDWEIEQERMSASAANQTTIGNEILKAFNQGA